MFLEAGSADAAGQGGGFAAGDLVFAEHLQEIEVPEGAVAGLGQSGVEGVEHAGEFEGAQRVAQCGVEDVHGSDLLLRVE